MSHDPGKIVYILFSQPQIIKYFSGLFNFMKVRLQKIGSTMYVRLPLDFVRLYKLRDVQAVDLKEDENGSLVISAEVR